MILHIRDIPAHEFHLVPIHDLEQQIKRDRNRERRALHQVRLSARERVLAAIGESEIEWLEPACVG